MSLKYSFARDLQRMLRGETLKASEIKDNRALNEFVSDGVVNKVPSAGKRFVYRVENPVKLENYLAANYQIKSLETFIKLRSQKEVSGTDSLRATHNTKEKRNQSNNMKMKPVF